MATGTAIVWGVMITVIANLKGGTGKSTVNFNLAVWLALQGRPVQVYDLDPQRTLTDVLEIREEEGFEPQIPLAHRLPGPRAKVLKEAEVLVDVGTADMEALRGALRRAHRIVVPVPPSQADVWSTQRFLRMIRELRPKGTPEVLGFINRADTHLFVRETEETAEALKLLPGIRPLKTRLHQRTAYRRSFSEGLAVFELEPLSKAARELQRLAGELYP